MLARKYVYVLAAILLVAAVTAQVQAAPPTHETRSVAPTYTIFATREGLVGKQTANGHIIRPRDHFVALPSWRNLSSYRGYEYQVRLTYNGRTTVVPVWDVGPWNTNDNYWSPNRENYRDLPVGLPMAQAAYLNGYNGGRDMFGRRILLPNGIDIADGTFWDSLGMTRNDWVQVTFLWLGEDPGPGNAVPIEPGPIPQPAPAPAPAPQPDPLDNPSVPDGAVAVDNGDPGYSDSGPAWEEARCGLNGTHKWVKSVTDAGSDQHAATWTPALSAGFYEVQAYIPTCGSPAATTSAQYRITYAGTVAQITLDQAAAAGTWTSLGTYRFSASGSKVELSNVTDDAGRAVRFDALAWIPRTDNTAPTSNVIQITRKDNGFVIEWSGDDDISGIETYDVQVRQLPKGGWRDWKMKVAETEEWFGPDEGKHFAFRVRARDLAGNQELWPEAAQMDTTQAKPPVRNPGAEPPPAEPAPTEPAPETPPAEPAPTEPAPEAPPAGG